MTVGDANPIACPSDSLLGWASETELTLAQQLGCVSRAHELDVAADDVERAERFFGTFIARQRAAGADAEALIAITPALTAASVTAACARVVNPDDLCAEYAAGLSLDGDLEFARAALDAYPALLDGLGLDRPHELSTVALGCLHAGLPLQETPWLIELVDIQAAAGMDGADDIVALLTTGNHRDVLAAAVEAGQAELDEDAEYPTAGQDLTVVSALAASAGDSMRRIIEGILTVRSASLEHPSSWQERLSAGDTGLPRLVWDLVVAEFRERPAGTRHRSWAVGAATRESSPRIVFDRLRGKVCVRLPEMRTTDPGADVLWRVTFAATTRVYRTSCDPAGTQEFTQPLNVAVTKQVREVTVTDVTHGLTWVLPVVDHDDPVLIFTEKGFNLTRKKSLHYGTLVVVCPEDASIHDPVAGTPLPIVDTAPLKGWPGWMVATVDASAAAGLIVGRAEALATTRYARCIDPRQRAHFHHPSSPLQAVHSGSGLPLHTESLVVEFPPTLSGTEERWWLSISGYAGTGRAGEEVAAPEPIDVPAEGGAFEVFDPEAYDDPWVGEYLVRLKGPRDESFRHQYAIAEGIGATVTLLGGSSQVRIPAAGGLSAADCRLGSGPKPASFDPRVVHIPEGHACAVGSIETDGGDVLPIRVSPEWLAFEIPVLGADPSWRTTRIAVGPRQLSTTGRVRLRLVGGMTKPQLQVRNAHGSPVLTKKLDTLNGVTFTTDVAPITRAVATMTRGVLDVSWVDPASGKQVSVTLADITTTPAWESVGIDGSVITVTGVQPGTRLGVWVWPVTAPWEMGRTVALSPDGTADIGQWVGHGPLLVQPHLADAFIPQRPPLVAPTTAMRLEQPGWWECTTPELTALAQFLSGNSDSAPDDPGIMPVLWEVVAALPHTGSGDEPAAATDVAAAQAAEEPTSDDDNSPLDMRAAVIAALRAHPAAALKGLSASLIPADELPGRVIATGLVHMVFDGSFAATETHRTAWIGTMELLASVAELSAPDTDHEEDIDADNDSEELSPSDRSALRALLSTLETVAGKRLVDTLSTGRDATLESACIDQSTVQIAHMDPAQQRSLLDMFFNRADLVPGPIMDDEARLMAIFDCFDKREVLSSLLANRELITAAVKLLKALRGANRALYQSARIRFDKLAGVDTADAANIWALAPVVSLVFALAARMHAHGMMEKPALLSQAAVGWSQLADIVPDLVTGDLISAEAMVIATQCGGVGVA